MTHVYDIQVNPSDLAIGRRAEKPMPSREELLEKLFRWSG